MNVALPCSICGASREGKKTRYGRCSDCERQRGLRYRGVPCADCGELLQKHSDDQTESICRSCIRTRRQAQRVLCAAGCGAVVRRRKGSAEEPMCRPCRSAHQAQLPGRKLTSVEKGYDWQHKLLRAEFMDRMKRGERFDCWRCDVRIDPSLPWDLGHDDEDRTVYRGPEHVGCNRGKSPRPAYVPAVAHRKGRLRDCEICGTEYVASYSRQRTCGRTCGRELQSRNRPRPPRPQKTPHSRPVRICDVCGQVSTRSICGLECRRVYMRNRYRKRVGIPLDAPLWSRAK